MSKSDIHWIAASVLVATATLAAPTQARWSGKIAAGGKHTQMQEYDGGRRIVKEEGWLPGVEATLGYGQEDWQMFGHGSWYRSDIDYHGSLQQGQLFNTETQTALLQWQVGVRHRLAQVYWLSLAAEYDLWRRDIKARDDIIGLREITHSRRISLEGMRIWWTNAWEITTAIGLYRAQPERLRVNFSGTFDPVSLKTQAATGYRFALTFAPRILDNLEIGVAYDHIRIGRSQPMRVAKDGFALGTIAQPEHSRQHTTVTVSYRF